MLPPQRKRKTDATKGNYGLLVCDINSNKKIDPQRKDRHPDRIGRRIPTGNKDLTPLKLQEAEGEIGFDVHVLTEGHKAKAQLRHKPTLASIDRTDVAVFEPIGPKAQA